jgi:hypothetical protein
MPYPRQQRPELIFEHPLTPNWFAPKWMINYLPCFIRHDGIHLATIGFLPIICIRRCKCLWNGFGCIIHEVYSEIITKGFWNPLSLTLSKRCFTILFLMWLQNFRWCKFRLFTILLFISLRFVYTFQRKNILKKCSISRFYYSINMHNR